MKRFLAFTLATGLLLGGCREQREADRTQETQDRARTESVASESVASRTASDFQYSVRAVLEDANRQIDQLAGTIRGRWDPPVELEVMLEDVRHRHAALRRDVRQLERRRGGLDRASQADVRRRLSALQRALEVAHLKAIRTRYEFENEIQSHVEGLEAQIKLIDRQLQITGCPVPFDDRWAVARLKNRHERVKQRLPILQTASRDEFADVRRRVTKEVAGLKAEVRRLADEGDCIAGTGHGTARRGG